MDSIIYKLYKLLKTVYTAKKYAIFPWYNNIIYKLFMQVWFYLVIMQTTKTISFDLFKNGIDILAVQIYTMYTSNANKETWSLDEIYQAK